MKKTLKNIASAGILAVFFIAIPVAYGKIESKSIPPPRAGILSPWTEKSSLNESILPQGAVPGDEFASEDNESATTVQKIQLKSVRAPRLQGVVLDGAKGAPLAPPAGQFLEQGNIAPAIVRMQKIEKMLWVAIVFGTLGLALGIFNLFLRRKDGLKRKDEISKLNN